MNEKTNVKAKKTRKFKPNIIDLLVVVIIIGAIAGIVIRNKVSDKIASQEDFEQARISFRVEGIGASTSECFNVGDAFSSVSHGCVFGTLESVWTNPAEIYVADQNGTLYKKEAIGDRVDLGGAFISEGVFTEDGFLLQGTHYISANSNVSVKGPGVSSYIVITDVERITTTEE